MLTHKHKELWRVFCEETEDFRDRTRVTAPFLRHREKFFIKLGLQNTQHPATAILWAIIFLIGGAAVAVSPPVARTFFAESGMRSSFARLIGIEMATTPVGWVIVGAIIPVVGYGIVWKLSRNRRGTIVRGHVDGEEDKLALHLAIFVVKIMCGFVESAGLNPSVIRSIRTYLVDGWGYTDRFIDLLIGYTLCTRSSRPLRDWIETLGAFARNNSNCNRSVILCDVACVLRETIGIDEELLLVHFGSQMKYAR